jgi:hypothetical protein
MTKVFAMGVVERELLLQRFSDQAKAREMKRVEDAKVTEMNKIANRNEAQRGWWWWWCFWE